MSAVAMVLTAAWLSPIENVDKVAVTDVKFSSGAAILTIQNNNNETIYMRQEALVQWNLTLWNPGTIQKNATFEPIGDPNGTIPIGGCANFTVSMQDGSQFTKGETYRFVVSTTKWIVTVYSIRYDSINSLD
jgi:hypothetical protein